MSEIMEQIKWERDVAIEQLKELGYGLGEKIRTDEDCISREEVCDYIAEFVNHEYATDREREMVKHIIDGIQHLPSVQSMRPKGKWIAKKVRGNEVLYCSNCDRGTDVIYNYAFCPNCGADMRGE